MHLIDTHCHLDAPEFAHDVTQVRQAAREQGVDVLLLPAVRSTDFVGIRQLAQAHGDAYALGLHPIYVQTHTDADLAQLDAALLHAQSDAATSRSHCVAVGEAGLDGFVPALKTPEMWCKQEHFLREQLKLAQRYQLPVILHVRHAVDAVLKHLRRTRVLGGIAHAFNGSLQQAHAFIDLGFKLGFGGAMTFERALRIRDLAKRLPLDAIVLETDAPDIAPQWLYRSAAEYGQQRQAARNEPAQLPRIAQVLADLRGIGLAELAHITSTNACNALPGLRNLRPKAV